jgi:hypothetical protein
VVIALVVVVVAGAGYELTKSHGATAAAPAQPALVAPPAAPQVATLHGPAALLANATANALAAKSAHVDVRDVVGKHGVVIYSDDDAIGGGIQRVRADGGHATVVVIGATTYVTADRVGFIKYFRMSASQARAIRGQWLPLIPGEPDYTSVTEDVTLASTLQEIGLAGPFKRLAARTKDGQRVFGLRGRATGDGMPKGVQATLWISVGAHGLPVEYDAIGAKASMTARFSHWGRPVNLTTPSPIVGASGEST